MGGEMDSTSASVPILSKVCQGMPKQGFGKNSERCQCKMHKKIACGCSSTPYPGVVAYNAP